MPFSEAIKLEVKRRSHFRCCRCQGIRVEVHHIVRKADGGKNTIDNAAPLCPSCHSDFGDNPQMRKEIRQMRDAWYERCEKEEAAGLLNTKEINRTILRTERKLGRKITAEVGSVRSELEYIRAGLSELAQSATVSGDVKLESKVRDLETRATFVSGVVSKDVFVGVDAFFSLARCPRCESDKLDWETSTTIGKPDIKTSYRCESCGHHWTN